MKNDYLYTRNLSRRKIFMIFSLSLFSMCTRNKSDIAINVESLPKYIDDCPCPKKKCSRHNRCKECYQYHGDKGKLPYCLRANKLRDRYLKIFQQYVLK